MIETNSLDKLHQVENNMFIILIYKIYDAIKNPKIEEYHSFFRGDMSINLELYKLLKQADALLDEISEDTIDFQLLYDFGSFIKLIEKVFLVRNDEENSIYCDSILEDKNTRTLIFNLKFEDTIIKTTAILQDHSINIEVFRDYGKHMKNTFKIIDGTIDLKYNSDKMLLDNILSMIADRIKRYLRHFITKDLLKTHEYDFYNIMDNYYKVVLPWDSKDFYNKEYKDIQWLNKHHYIQI